MDFIKVVMQYFICGNGDNYIKKIAVRLSLWVFYELGSVITLLN